MVAATFVADVVSCIDCSGLSYSLALLVLTAVLNSLDSATRHYRFFARARFCIPFHRLPPQILQWIIEKNRNGTYRNNCWNCHCATTMSRVCGSWAHPHERNGCNRNKKSCYSSNGSTTKMTMTTIIPIRGPVPFMPFTHSRSVMSGTGVSGSSNGV
jgi:hypothetical protein